MKNILVVTGGTGGHVVPSIALLEHLKNNFSVEIVTDVRGSKYINKSDHSYQLIDVPNLFSKFYLLPLNIIKYLINIFQSLNFIKKKKIDIIISTGGYMTFPFCIAALLFKKKIILFEPNSVLGRSNKFILKFSDTIICYDNNLKNFPKKYNFKKKIIQPILKKDLYKIQKNKNSLKEIKKLLVIGGSQGATFFDNKITDIIIQISKKKDFHIIQQISKKNSKEQIQKKYDKINLKYNFFEFINNSKYLYEDVDLAITRGGASTLSELSFLNIPFLVIPLPSARDNHQFYNSNYYYQKKCCWLIEQKNFNVDYILELILKILDNHEDYSEKVNNLEKISEKNTWNNINNRIMEIINEN